MVVPRFPSLPSLLAGFLLLLAGATINVAVAWGWAAWGVPPHADLGMWSVSSEDSPFWLMQGQVRHVRVRPAPRTLCGLPRVWMDSRGR